MSNSLDEHRRCTRRCSTRHKHCNLGSGLASQFQFIPCLLTGTKGLKRHANYQWFDTIPVEMVKIRLMRLPDPETVELLVVYIYALGSPFEAIVSEYMSTAIGVYPVDPLGRFGNSTTITGQGNVSTGMGVPSLGPLRV